MTYDGSERSNPRCTVSAVCLNANQETTTVSFTAKMHYMDELEYCNGQHSNHKLLSTRRSSILGSSMVAQAALPTRGVPRFRARRRRRASLRGPGGEGPFRPHGTPSRSGARAPGPNSSIMARSLAAVIGGYQAGTDPDTAWTGSGRSSQGSSPSHLIPPTAARSAVGSTKRRQGLRANGG